MKTVNIIVKILAALAAVTGVVYVVATYGDRIVAWAKHLLESCPCKCEPEDCVDAEDEEAVEEAVEEPAAEEAVEEVVVEATDAVADEADFAE